MKLYYSPGACSMASHIVACEEGLPIGLEKVDLTTHKTARGEDFTRINPKGYVPALLLDDGTLLTENTAVLPYLADAKPAAGLAPPSGTLARAHLEEWLGTSRRRSTVLSGRSSTRRPRKSERRRARRSSGGLPMPTSISPCARSSSANISRWRTPISS